MFSPIEEFQPEAVFHLAWEGLPDFSEPQCRRNVQHSLNFLGMLGQISSIRKIVVTGSCWEYGERTGACSETDTTIPDNWFAWAKEAISQYVKRLCDEKKIDWYWGRVFFVYGPGQRTNSLIPSVVRAMQKGELPDVRSPYAKNDLVYIDDVVRGLSACLTKGAPSGIYNFGSGKETTVLDVVCTLENLLFGSSKITSQINSNARLPEKAPNSFYANTEASRTKLEWHANITLRDGLQKILEYE